ncbi:hypothetical protein UFVDC4_00163 [Staphylococcus phage vB_SauM-UFV_DC4]|nr:hypothetical protein UFVDC4_00163 [Staphylococcus phage vB_SauM-UFV_DC4]
MNGYGKINKKVFNIDRSNFEVVLMDYMDTKQMKNNYNRDITDQEKIDRLIPLIKQQENEQDEGKIFENARRYELLLAKTFEYSLNGKLELYKLKEVLNYYEEKNLFNIVYPNFRYTFNVESPSKEYSLLSLKTKIFLIIETIIDFIKNDYVEDNLSIKLILNSEEIMIDTLDLNEKSLCNTFSLQYTNELLSYNGAYLFSHDQVKSIENINNILFKDIYKDKDKEILEFISKKVKNKYISKYFK